MCKSFERAVITHCAPTLARHKCASLFTWHGCEGRPRRECVAEADDLLQSKGVRLLAFRGRGAACLVLVYRPAMLERRLRDPAVRAFLRAQGYVEDSLEGYLSQLGRRLEESAEFPHEIGVFLDYPLEDVQGFMANGGAGAVCQGCWKAYGDAQEAYRRFRLYGKCREVYLSCYRRGFDVLRLTVAA